MEFIKKFWKWLLAGIAIIVAILLARPGKDTALDDEKLKNKKLEDLNKNIRRLENEGKEKVYDKFAENADEIQKKTVELRDQIQRDHENRLESIKNAEEATEAIKGKLK